MEKNINDYTPEEIQQMIEKAQRDLQETLAKMTPEERAEAERKAQEYIAQDNAKMQSLIDDANRVAAQTSAQNAQAPKFCPSCGAPASGGYFCQYCGNPLKG